MSRIGKKPIVMRPGVTCSILDGTVQVSNGSCHLVQNILSGLDVRIEDASIHVTPLNTLAQTSKNWGTMCRLIDNMVSGLSVGFEKKLTIEGTGYRVFIEGSRLKFQLGYSRDVWVDIPSSVQATSSKNTELNLKGYNTQVLGEFVSLICNLRPSDPYKGKGIHLEGAFIRRKESKKKK